jgi:hypothetical protein
MGDSNWRDNITPASAELRRLRASGLTVNDALDRMRGRGFTLAAVTVALHEVEAMEFADITQLLDARDDWDDF